MRTGAFILLFLFSLPGYGQEPCDLLVLPVFGVVPPEMKLPGSEEVAGLFRARLPKGIEVAAEEPTVGLAPEDVEGLARNRARARKARVVVWWELRSPGRCPAPRAMRVYVLDRKADVLLQRDLCPRNFVKRRMVKSVIQLVESDLIMGLRSASGKTDRRARIRKAPGPQALAPPCPQPEPCPKVDCPEPVPAQTGRRARGLLAAGVSLTSHPRWESAGLGAAVELSWSPLSWLETGLALQAVWSRRIDEETLQAVYSSWPLVWWGRLRFGPGPLEGLLDLGLQATFTRLEETGTGISRSRVKPAAVLRLGVRWLPDGGPGVQVTAGSCAYLSGQSYGGYSMPWYSFELAASLVVPVW